MVQWHGDYVSRLQKLTIIKREAWDEEGGAPSSYLAFDEGSGARLVLARGRTCESRRCHRSDPASELHCGGKLKYAKWMHRGHSLVLKVLAKPCGGVGARGQCAAHLVAL